MAYHAHDYYMNVDEFPKVTTYRELTVQNLIQCAMKAEEKQLYTLFFFGVLAECAGDTCDSLTNFNPQH